MKIDLFELKIKTSINILLLTKAKNCRPILNGSPREIVCKFFVWGDFFFFTTSLDL